MKLKKRNKKGFTLAELLIVVAIIAVLVAIAIPIFTGQLEKSRDTTSVANMRAAYAEAMSAYLTETTSGNVTYNDTEKTVTVTGIKIETQQANNWSDQAGDLPFDAPDDPGANNDNATMVFKYVNDELDSVTLS